jgi:hypothetical protein
MADRKVSRRLWIALYTGVVGATLYLWLGLCLGWW